VTKGSPRHNFVSYSNAPGAATNLLQAPGNSNDNLPLLTKPKGDNLLSINIKSKKNASIFKEFIGRSNQIEHPEPLKPSQPVS
jgi:hypothetical protein